MDNAFVYAGILTAGEWETLYNSLSSPSTFASVGSETEAGGEPPATVIKDMMGMGFIPFPR
jgi:hypothetical protein